MKKIIVTLAAFALVLCACSGGNANPRVTTVTKIPGPADTALPNQIIFAVESGADEIILSAAEAFCRKVNSLSKGAFILTLTSANDPLAELQSGKAGFILLGGGEASSIHPYFGIANERFRYKSYESFSMTCNSERVLDKLSGVSGWNVFAAYYTGSNMLAGLRPLDEIFAADKQAAPDAPLREPEVFTIPGSGTGDVFHPPLATATGVADADERVKMLSSNDVVVELPLPGLPSSKITAAAPAFGDTSDGAPDEHGNVVITRTFHSITPTWLIIAPPVYESLSSVGRAAIAEAAAFLTSNIDDAYLRLEQEYLDVLEEDDILISSKFLSTRTKILRLRDEALKDISTEEKYFRELLDRI